jgi:hypothetical protein
MKGFRFSVLFLSICILAMSYRQHSILKIAIRNNWQFRKTETGYWLPAKVLLAVSIPTFKTMVILFNSGERSK